MRNKNNTKPEKQIYTDMCTFIPNKKRRKKKLDVSDHHTEIDRKIQAKIYTKGMEPTENYIVDDRKHRTEVVKDR